MVSASWDASPFVLSYGLISELVATESRRANILSPSRMKCQTLSDLGERSSPTRALAYARRLAKLA